MLVSELLIEPFEQAALGVFGAEAADLVQGLPLDVEEIVEFRLAAVGIFNSFAELALVVFDHLLLFLKLVGTALDEVLLFIEMPFALEEFLPGVVELVFDARLFAERELFGLDFGFFMACSGLDFRIFENLASFLLGVQLPQVAEELDEPHSHETGEQGDDHDQPWVGALGLLLSEQ